MTTPTDLLPVCRRCGSLLEAANIDTLRYCPREGLHFPLDRIRWLDVSEDLKELLMPGTVETVSTRMGAILRKADGFVPQEDVLAAFPDTPRETLTAAREALGGVMRRSRETGRWWLVAPGDHAAGA